MRYGVMMSGPNPYKNRVDDPDWIVQALHHNLTNDKAANLKRIIENEIYDANMKRPPNQRVFFEVFNHALDHPEVEVSLCKACVAALQERYDMLAEDASRAQAAAGGVPEEITEDS